MTKRIFNRLLAVALALCLMTSLLNLSAFAADGGADASAISLEAGQTVGQMVFTLDGETVGETPLVVTQSISDLRAGERSLLDWLRLLWLGSD